MMGGRGRNGKKGTWSKVETIKGGKKDEAGQ
jgi:hypothetical protein